MRTGLRITEREKRQVESAIRKLDNRFAKGKIDKRLYDYQRGRLMSNLQRPTFNETNLARNAKAWWKRNEINHSPAPVGYWERGSKPMVSQNKIRASMVSFCDNGYWNSNDFQDSIRTVTNNAASNNNSDFFEETVMAGENLGMTANEAWNEIANSPEVTQSLKRLENTIDNTVKKMMSNGLPEQDAIANVRAAAISSGRTLTESGYDTELAKEIIKAVLCGQMSLSQATNHVANDMNNISHAINNALAQNVSNDSSTMNAGMPNKAWNNGLNFYNNTPSGTSLQSLIEYLKMLQNKYDLLNNPVERNQLAFAMNEVQNEINRRQNGIESVTSAPESNVNSVNVPSQGGYKPQNNLYANRSTMQDTVRAMANGPSISLVVKDIFTVDSNIYFDWTAGKGLEMADNGQYAVANNHSNPDMIYPSGEWTVFANANSVGTLQSIMQALDYALASPLWSVGDRSYLMYLRSRTEEKIYALTGVSNNAINNAINNEANNMLNQMNNNANNTPDPATMSDWFINHMRGDGQLTQYGDVEMDGAVASPPVALSTAAGEWDYSKVRQDIPDFAQHGRNDFNGDWARKASNGSFYRPTAANNFRGSLGGSTSMTTSNSSSHPKSILRGGRMLGMSTSTTTSSASGHPKDVWHRY